MLFWNILQKRELSGFAEICGLYPSLSECCALNPNIDVTNTKKYWFEIFELHCNSACLLTEHVLGDRGTQDVTGELARGLLSINTRGAFEYLTGTKIQLGNLMEILT